MACYQNPLGIFPNFFNLTKLTVDADLILVTPLPRCPGTSEEGGGQFVTFFGKSESKIYTKLCTGNTTFSFHDCARVRAMARNKLDCIIALSPDNSAFSKNL